MALNTSFRFEGSLTQQDNKTYKSHTFEVPGGTTNIHVDFVYSPIYSRGRIYPNLIELSFNDPVGIRGVYSAWNRVSPSRDPFDIIINGVFSSPGFHSDPIQPGIWTAYIGVQRVLPPDTVTYELKITLSNDPIEQTAWTFYDLQYTANPAPGWYKGDLHGHSNHSDGVWSIREFNRYMQARGLDFATLTDHNTISGIAEQRQQTKDGYLAMAGMEITTFNGHLLAIGASEWHEWRIGIEHGANNITEIMQYAVDTTSLLIMAHPMEHDALFSIGRHWDYDEARPGLALGMEVWSGEWGAVNRGQSNRNEEALLQFYDWLNMGLHVVATAGSNIHHIPLLMPHITDHTIDKVGLNIVYAKELSESAIIDAVIKGHVYLSSGPELLLTAETASGQKAMVGDTLPDEDVTVTVKWDNVPEGSILRLVAPGGGHTVNSEPVGDSGEESWTFPAGQIKWCCVELRDNRREMLALTNPIFFGERKRFFRG